MKPIIIITALILASLTISLDAHAEFTVRPVVGYAQFEGGRILGDTSGSHHSRTKKEDVVGGIAAAASYSAGSWRYELEYALRVRTDANAYVYYDDYDERIRSNVQNQSLTANVYREFDIAGIMQPYVVVGAGIVRHWSESDYNHSAGLFADEFVNGFEAEATWALGAGFKMELNRGWMIDLGYRYVDLGKPAQATFSNGRGYAPGPLVSHDIALTISRSSSR